MEQDKLATKSSGTSAKLGFVLAMAVFGTIGIFRRGIPIGSGWLGFFRGAIGTVFLLLLVLLCRQRFSFAAIRKNLTLLAVSGALIGLNWVLLFEAYRYTTVATATLCYYMAPIFVLLCSPFLLKERLTLKQGICIGIALIGMVPVSGILQSGAGGATDLLGILLGLGAALFYATVILLNQKLQGLTAYEKTTIQLFFASGVLLPYSLLTEGTDELSVTPAVWGLVLLCGVVHTGLAYALYFGSMGRLKAQTVALLSYLDPVVAILLSACLLREKIGISGGVGAVMILGAAWVAESGVSFSRFKRKNSRSASHK